MRKRSYEEQADELERRIEALREQKRRALARHGEEERKAAEHAEHVLGGLVLEQYPDGWKSIDLHRLEEVLEKNAAVFAACTAEALPVRDAMARMRTWERARRGRSDVDDEGRSVADE